MDKNFGIVIICTAILFLCFVGTASATTWSVDGSGGANFTGIQDAINNAKEGDTILVYSGVYYENVVVNKSVTLRGIGHPVVDARRCGKSVVTLSADGITVEGFNVTKCSWEGAGITISSSNNTITGNTVCHNNKEGIALLSSSNNTITDNNISNNICGIFLWHSSNNNTITGNNVSNNEGGISLWYSSNNNTITGNNVSSNNEEGIDLRHSNNNNTITGNNVSNNNMGGISLSYSNNNNTITGNNVSNNNMGGIAFDGSNNTITGNTFVNNGLFVIEAYQNTVEDNIVNGKPLVYLEDASDYKVEDAGQVILVNCTNITVETLDLSNTSVGIELWDTEDSIISNNTVSNNIIGIFLGSSRNNTITGNKVSNNYGGIGLVDSCNNTITGNNVSNNNEEGIDLDDSSNNNTLTGNNVCSNNRYGIRLDDSSNNTITGNNVCSNNWYGISLDNSSNNTITGNNVCNNNRGIHFSSSSNNNTITGNDVSNNNYDGIRLYYSSNNTITGNNVCNNNWGGINWGGIDLSSSSNNTITGNNVRNNDKGISLSSSSNNTITGNNVCNNSGNDIDLYSYSNNNTITGNTFVSGGLSVRGSFQNTVEDNTVNGKPLVYLEDVSNYKIEDAGQVILLNCNNVTVEDLYLSNTSVGIELWNTEDSTISNNTVCSNSGGGIHLESSSNNNTITGNNVSNNKDEGIRLYDSSNNNTITGNNVSNNKDEGIRLYDSSNNNTITGNNVSNNRCGIRLYDSSNNNTITGNNVSNNKYGIRLYYSSNNTITGNNVCNNNWDGIDLYSYSNNNTITGNNVCNNKDEGIRLSSSSNNNTITGNTFVSGGLSIRGSFQNTVEDNTVNGKPLVYLKDVSNYKIEDAGQVILVNCSNIRVKNLDLSNTSVGIYLWETKDCIVSNNKVCNNSGGGIDLKSSSNNNTITGNNVCSNNGEGIRLDDSSNNTLTGNNVRNNKDEGIRLDDSSNNIVTGNNVSSNKDEGIFLYDSNNNTITGNNVSNNDDYFNLWYSSNNIFYRNNFINNTDNFSDWDGETEEIDEEIVTVKEGIRGIVEAVKELIKSIGISHGNWGSTNTWNSTEKITYTYNGSTYTNYLGNYWSDYEEKYPDAEAIDTTGIWDTPYNIGGAKDNYPLMERFENYGIICSPIVHPPAAEPIIAPVDNFTEFYILGPNETASGYPTNLTVGEDGKVIIGIVNHEYTNVTYQLEVWLSGELIDGNSIELKHNETWESPFTFRVTKAGRQKLEFLLFKDGLKEPYRDLHLWVDVK